MSSLLGLIFFQLIDFMIISVQTHLQLILEHLIMGEKEVAEVQEENPPEQSSGLHKSPPTTKLLDHEVDNTHQEASDQDVEESESLKERKDRRLKRRRERRAEMVVCEICGKNVRRHYKLVHMKSHSGVVVYSIVCIFE